MRYIEANVKLIVIYSVSPERPTFPAIFRNSQFLRSNCLLSHNVVWYNFSSTIPVVIRSKTN